MVGRRGRVGRGKATGEREAFVAGGPAETMQQRRAAQGEREAVRETGEAC